MTARVKGEVARRPRVEDSRRAQAQLVKRLGGQSHHHRAVIGYNVRADRLVRRWDPGTGAFVDADRQGPSVPRLILVPGPRGRMIAQGQVVQRRARATRRRRARNRMARATRRIQRRTR